MQFALRQCVPFKFEWDPAKAIANLAAHGVSFEEARDVFDDLLSSTVNDPDHSTEESRFRTIGLSRANRLLVVVHTDRGDTIRIISARSATRREQHHYEEHSI
jgi:uncharacterized DUF497 family protein